MSILSERLRTARERKSLRQTQVKDRVGINNKTLSGYENGVSEPDLETLKILADLYEVTIDWLTGASDSSPTSMNNQTQKKLDSNVEPEEREFLDWVKNNLEGTFFYDFSKSPEEQKREMMRGLRLIYEMEKGRRKE